MDNFLDLSCHKIIAFLAKKMISFRKSLLGYPLAYYEQKFMPNKKQCSCFQNSHFHFFIYESCHCLLTSLFSNHSGLDVLKNTSLLLSLAFMTIRGSHNHHSNALQLACIYSHHSLSQWQSCDCHLYAAQLACNKQLMKNIDMSRWCHIANSSYLYKETSLLEDTKSSTDILNKLAEREIETKKKRQNEWQWR